MRSARDSCFTADDVIKPPAVLREALVALHGMYLIRIVPLLTIWLAIGRPAMAIEPVPDKLVVLTFDDASKSHYTIVRPLLLKHKFGATFFVTEGWDFATNKTDYMSWEEIAQLHRDGFEIGNHTRDHKGVTDKSIPDLPAQVLAINARCEDHGIP